MDFVINIIRTINRRYEGMKEDEEFSEEDEDYFDEEEEDEE